MPTRPFELISLDIVGPFPRSANGNRFLLTMIDQFTRYAEGVPLREQTAEATARALVDCVITRHGVPGGILTDQGRNFVSELFKAVCRTLGIRKLQTTAYHPESNGMLERFHRTLTESMAHFARRDGRDWDRWVPYALMAYRAIPHSSTGYSPNYLMYGRELEYPLRLSPPQDVGEAAGDHVTQLTERLQVAYKNAVESAERAWKERSRYCNRGRRPRDFAAGDSVYLRNPAIKPGHFAKFHCPWTGPHRVMDRLSDVTYRVRLATGGILVVHVNRLKRASGEAAEAVDEDNGVVEEEKVSSESKGDEEWPGFPVGAYVLTDDEGETELRREIEGPGPSGCNGEGEGVDPERGQVAPVGPTSGAPTETVGEDEAETRREVEEARPLSGSRKEETDTPEPGREPPVSSPSDPATREAETPQGRTGVLAQDTPRPSAGHRDSRCPLRMESASRCPLPDCVTPKRPKGVLREFFKGWSQRRRGQEVESPRTSGDSSSSTLVPDVEESSGECTLLGPGVDMEVECGETTSETEDEQEGTERGDPVWVPPAATLPRPRSPYLLRRKGGDQGNIGDRN